jgi:hypothetical protein
MILIVTSAQNWQLDDALETDFSTKTVIDFRCEYG